MRITESQLRRIVRQEILREQGEVSTDDKYKKYPKVKNALDSLDAALQSKASIVGTALTDANAIALFVDGLFEKIEAKFPALKGKMVKGLAAATKHEREEAQQGPSK